MPPRRNTTREPTADPVDPAEVQLPPDDDLNVENPLDHRESSEELTPNLAEAIVLMTSELRQRGNNSGTKVKEPDTFDGSEPRKLNNFILLCNLYFRNNSTRFDDSAKVTFALSYLRGLALEFFEPALLDSDEVPEWLESWPTFLDTLRNQFGPIDPAADAEDSIDHLKMRDNQRIIKYNVEFNRLAIQTGWGDSVLRHRYYSGLADRIKDNMGHLGKPSTLDSMKKLAHSIDSRHWERVREKSRSEKQPPSKSDKPANTNNSSTNKNSSNNSKSTSNTSNSNKSKATSSGNSATKSDISDKLKDGKLTQQERQRRMDNNLCMYCGGVGHKASECSKSNSSASKAKGRSAKVTATPATPAKEDPTPGKA